MAESSTSEALSRSPASAWADTSVLRVHESGTTWRRVTSAGQAGEGERVKGRREREDSAPR